MPNFMIPLNNWRSAGTFAGPWRISPPKPCLAPRQLGVDAARTNVKWWAISATLLVALAALEMEAKSTSLLRDQLLNQGYQQIELRRSGENRLFLFGRLEGRKQSVLVDTGWSFTTVSTNAAKTLKLRPELELQPRDPFPRANADSPAIMINSLNLGQVAFTNQPALVQNLVFNGERAPFDVVVGCDFLIRNFAVIDCANRRLYTRASPPLAEQQTDLENRMRQGGFVAVGLKRTNPLALTCPVRLNGEPVELLVDTGGVWSCLDAEAATRLGLKLLPTPRQITGAGMTGRRGFAVTQAKSVELGGAEFGRVNFAALSLGDWGLANPGAALPGVGGILGAPELAAWQTVIDCHGLRLWIKPLAPRR